jgi:hypothetical protein
MNKKLSALIDLVALLALLLGAGAAIGGIAFAPGTQLDGSLLMGGFVVALVGIARLSRFFRF